MVGNKRTNALELNGRAIAEENVFSEAFDGYEISVKKTLSLQEMMEFVESAVDMCFKDDGTYMPEIKDFAILRNFVIYYTNMDLPSDAGTCYSYLYNGLNIIENARKLINQRQYHMMIEALESRIDNIVQANITGAANKINSLMDSFSSMANMIESMASSIDKDELQNMVKAITDGKIDEEKLVKAVLNNKKAE